MNALSLINFLENLDHSPNLGQPHVTQVALTLLLHAIPLALYIALLVVYLAEAERKSTIDSTKLNFASHVRIGTLLCKSALLRIPLP
jgi:hypothetical protein